MNWLKNLSIYWKVVLAVAVLALTLFIFDATTGYIRDAKNWMFDNKQAKVEAQNEALLAENAKLRAEAKAAVDEAIRAKAKEAVLDEREKNLDTKTKVELEKVDKALEQQKREEEITAQPVDNVTRCLRLKEKLLALGSTSAKNMVCEEDK